MDYDSTPIPKQYRAARGLSAPTMRAWLSAIRQSAPLRSGSRVADVGCGTGRFSAGLADAYASHVVALDRSAKMLAEVPPRDERVSYCRGDAQALPLCAASIEMVFLSNVVHHLADLPKAAEGFARVLGPSGFVVVRNYLREQLQDVPYLAFFPDAHAVSRRSLSSAREIEGAFRRAGFRLFSYRGIRQPAAGSPIEYGGVAYSSVALFTSATGNEAHGSGANPRFANPAAANYHPGSGPAIDSADASASGFQSLDLAGLPPLDQPAVANTGAGVPNYADRGALEAVDAAPIARLTVTPKRTTRFVPVTANASASADDIGIVSYRFAWGDGQVTTQAGPIATHSYASTGPKKVILTVTDTSGQTASAQVNVQVR